jgi:integrase
LRRDGAEEEGRAARRRGPRTRRAPGVEKAYATVLDERELSAHEIADQLGHEKVFMTQDNYLGRRLTSRRTAEAIFLQLAVGGAACRK